MRIFGRALMVYWGLAARKNSCGGESMHTQFLSYRCWQFVVLTAVLFLSAPIPAAQNAATGELVNVDTLRVCSSPANLPFSNRRGEGFENQIAELFAAKLGMTVSYTWYPPARGFVRNTLNKRFCDLIIGITGLHELTQNSNPYYRTSWALVIRADNPRQVENLDSPALAEMKIGIIAASPPVTALAKRGLLKNMVSYPLRVDTRVENPSQEILTAVADGNMDAALIYGPIAGYWADKLQKPLRVIPLDSQASGTRMDFVITMGMRRNEPLWKEKVNGFLRDNREEIDAILYRYGIPLLPI